MTSNIDPCLDLLEIIHQKDDVIEVQGNTIARLINQNVEQENVIRELMRSQVDEPH